ncbi:ribosomal RNA processing protein 1 homolog isoform X2 [Anabrus simplex]|uniref:ribosomal RNA processing protein 1 homolog isoform X2 n=1 Tax=Anabrus simplex TaxID=316456 RepID=UPI0035A269CA
MGGTRGKVLLTVQQISFAKLLAGNDKKTRDGGLRKLRKYFTSRSEGIDKFKEDDFMRIWKGLYYCVWMSDKPLIQLVRRFLRQVLVYCHQRDWSEELVNQITTMFSSTVLSNVSASSGKPSQLGLTLHFTDIFLEELAKVSKGELPQNILLQFLKPFLQHLSEQDEARSRTHVVQHIFHYLMKQSDMGIEYEDKFTAWKQAGFPGESCEDMERVELDDSSDSDRDTQEENWNTDAKDPRAGKVNVTLPQLQFDPEKVAEIILEYAKSASVLKSRKILYKLNEQFSDMARGTYPLAFKLKVPEGVLLKKRMRAKKSELWDAAKSLMLFEESLKNEEMEQSESKKRKHGGGDSDIEFEGTSTKLKRSEVILTHCDSPNGNIKSKFKKRKVSNVVTKTSGVSGLSKGVLNGDRTSDRLSKKVICSEEVKLELPERKTKVSKSATVRNGVKPKVPVKLMKCVQSVRDKKGKSTPLKKLQICLNRWEVSDICNKANQSFQAYEENQPKQLPEEEANFPEKEVPSSTSPSTASTEVGAKSTIPPEETTQSTSPKKLLPNGTAGSAKKVNIALQMNKEQKISDYVKAVRKSPSVPFDAARKPIQGVLKPSPFSSPINPFYRRSGRKLSSIL